MPKTKQKQEIKRCEVCNRFISPKSETLRCDRHLPAHAISDELNLKANSDIQLQGHGELTDKPGKEFIKFNPEPLVFGDPIKPGEINDLLTFDNNKVYSRVDEDNFIDIGEFVGGKFVPTNRIPSKDEVDFKTEFVYDALTVDKLKEVLNGIKMTEGGQIKYKVYLKRTNEQ